MSNELPSCSTSCQTEDFKELSLVQGINVWGTNQSVLEEQALKELELFSKETTTATDKLEDGEIEDNVQQTKSTSLDVNSYIKQQEEFKKRKEQLKSSQVSEQSRNAAENICKKQRIHKAKRKRSVNNYESKVASISICEKNDNTEDNKISEIDKNADDEKSGSEYIPSDLDDSDYEPNPTKTTVEKIVKQRKSLKQNFDKVKDDGLISCYKERLHNYYTKLEEEAELKALDPDADGNSSEDDIKELKGGLKIPRNVWERLYGYQKEGIKWLWSLHTNATGGLLGDEMGLGKTVQVIVFLHSLEFSKVASHGRFVGLGASIIACPATVIHQWVQHFHEWAPEIRVAVLHQSGTYQGNKSKLIREIHECKGIILTTYLGILKYKGNLIEHNWHYLILDEGHKIRNPGAKISVAVKQIRTPYRLMLTGSPMQNNLTELWSLFDFTNPGMLGNLQVFTEHFANPILHGGFANATPMQEATALSVALTLKNVIDPYLLRRTKAEVQHHILLPNKSEQVLFCSLTKEQKDLYKGYLMSEQVNSILGRGVQKWYSDKYLRGSVLVAITTLRKICNHPDLYLYDTEDYNQDVENTPVEEKFGFYKRSGKMVVVSALLKIWKKQKHRVLLFTQGRAMITIFQEFLEQHGYTYVKMDGSTSISTRQPLIDKFNNDDSIDVFLSTTRVGGLGVNLTGADRVIIYDPDWNPATDTQARERAWRIGQDKQVTVYRLVSAGTIEEKMYQRQVWKQLLSNKILIDPKTHRFFKSSDLYDLFSLQESPENNETANIFHDSRVKIQERIQNETKTKRNKKKSMEVPTEDLKFTDDKIQAMKDLAKKISAGMTGKKEEVKKTGYQKELDEERQKKLKEKAELKKLTPMELIIYNRKKAEQKQQEALNKIDDLDTNASFSKALEFSEKTSKLYHDLTLKKIKEIDVKNNEEEKKAEKPEKIKRKRSESEDEENPRKKHKKKSKDKSKNVIVDTSRKVDGEEIEGLVKSEITKKKKKEMEKSRKEDNFVLEKLFSKKGVSGALEHDTIMQGKRPENSLRIHTEAKNRATKSLEALRKSRVDNWRW
ncbi:unnamed protein product [Brassicogethes aeneus]|uniref:DNA repair and recombination protein RAD54-like n=1 Tax=Brassicogethes aeneus TaxID=1431903 RepID=A0A9P0AZ51_BRAAE|nr:unnamed protein product [Brassicogethes aeneus]